MAYAVPACREAQRDIRALCRALGLAQKGMPLPPPIDIPNKPKKATPEEEQELVEMTIGAFLGMTGLMLAPLKGDFECFAAECDREITALTDTAQKAHISRKKIRSTVRVLTRKEG